MSVAFVRPSVHLSVCPYVAYIANNSRTQRPSVTKFAMKVATVDATRTPISRSNGQRSDLQTGTVVLLCIFSCTQSLQTGGVSAEPCGHTARFLL